MYVVPEAKHKARLSDPEPFKGRFLGGTKEKKIRPDDGSLICPPGEKITKSKLKKKVLLARPGVEHLNPVVASVNYSDVAFRVGDYSCHVFELTYPLSRLPER